MLGKSKHYKKISIKQILLSIQNHFDSLKKFQINKTNICNTTIFDKR